MVRRRSSSSKRLASTKKYIDRLQENNSKLNIVRVDLAYKKPYSDSITLEEANKDLNSMFNNMRSKPSIFKHKVGHVIKREYTQDKGIHFHALFIFDGQKVQKDSFKASQIGNYWEQQITKEKGSHYNCNRNNYKNEGVGMLEHKDTKKREILDDVVVTYLCKDEQSIQSLTDNKRTRAFTRGAFPKSKGNIGRPRG